MLLGRNACLSDKLQWGHDKIVMEVSALSKPGTGLPVLQWGHDKIVMEVMFPGATFKWNPGLQWGHDKIVMEVHVGRQIFHVMMNASMGP